MLIGLLLSQAVLVTKKLKLLTIITYNLCLYNLNLIISNPFAPYF